MAKNHNNPISYTLKEVPISQVNVWHEVQARELDLDGVADLAKSIQSEGLQNPPLVQKESVNSYLLMAGQRRLAAMQKLGAKTIPVLVLDKNSSHNIDDAKASSVIENLHRKEMNPKDMAQSCKFLAQKMGKSNAAKALGIQSRTLKKYLGFAGVPEKIKELVPKTISRADAIRICNVVSSVERCAEVAATISKYDVAAKRRYIDALEHLGASAEHSEIRKLANRFRARQNLSMKISKRQAKGLVAISTDADMEPQEMAKKIVSDYLSRKGYPQ